MAKTLQEILDPKFIPDIVSRIWGNTPPLIIKPKYILVKHDYNIPKQQTDEELIQVLLESSIAYANGCRLMTVCSRGNNKLYMRVESC